MNQDNMPCSNRLSPAPYKAKTVIPQLSPVKTIIHAGHAARWLAPVVRPWAVNFAFYPSTEMPSKGMAFHKIKQCCTLLSLVSLILQCRSTVHC